MNYYGVLLILTIITNSLECVFCLIVAPGSRLLSPPRWARIPNPKDNLVFLSPTASTKSPEAAPPALYRDLSGALRLKVRSTQFTFLIPHAPFLLFGVCACHPRTPSRRRVGSSSTATPSASILAVFQFDQINRVIHGSTPDRVRCPREARCRIRWPGP